MSKPTIISDRAEILLRTLVERYIQDGQPVGSRTLSEASNVNLSPATIRNVLADLEELGLIIAPHTSSGRVPTVGGYRMFVDRLLKLKPLGEGFIEDVKLQLHADDNKSIIDNASSLLSEVTKLAGVITLPRRYTIKLQHVEFLTLSPGKVMVILVGDNQEVQNRIIHTRRSYQPDELHRVANYLNQEFVGKELSSIRKGILDSLQQTRDNMHMLMQTAVEMADNIIQSNQTEDCILAGQVNLMDYAEMGNMDKLKQLFEAFNTKHDILHILDQSIEADGLQIFIGEESGYSAFEDVSVITTPYRSSEGIIGVLGVIGPKRMAYDRVIPVVDITAKILSTHLSSE